jgi:class I fructose-bisphosphate aldolase
MSKRVKEILSWYSADNPGTLANLARVLNHGRLGGTGKLVILPVDQGFEHGPARSFAPNPAAYDPRFHFELGIEAGCNAYAAPLGFLEAGAAEFAGDIPLILKLNSSDSLYSGGDPCPALTGSVDDALRLGCSAIGFTIYPASAERNEMYGQISALAEEAKSKGLAVVVWSYPRGSGISKEGETAVDVIAYAAQLAAQLGAHMIKVKPPTTHIESPPSTADASSSSRAGQPRGARRCSRRSRASPTVAASARSWAATRSSAQRPRRSSCCTRSWRSTRRPDAGRARPPEPYSLPEPRCRASALGRV